MRVTDDVILDMEAGLEHMGRASARGVDAMIAVVEPGMRSVQTAQRVQRLAKDIGIRRTFVVPNKIRDPHDVTCSSRHWLGKTILGELPYVRGIGPRRFGRTAPSTLSEAAFCRGRSGEPRGNVGDDHS